jgi:ABC-type Na+ efflux pump permease subunit
LARFDLSNRAGERVDRLSNGNQQKVQFLAAILHRPRAVRRTSHRGCPALIGPGAAERKQRPGTVVVIVVIGAMLLGLFTGFGYVFVAITAEKTQRTTESLLSILSPQEWIDGKIAGLTGVVLVSLLNYLAAWFLWQAVAWRFCGGSVALPSGLGGLDLVWGCLFAAAGFAFWFTLFALSFGLLPAGALALRWAAGRVFGASMLMTGKEPGLREIWRWLRET